MLYFLCVAAGAFAGFFFAAHIAKKDFSDLSKSWRSYCEGIEEARDDALKGWRNCSENASELVAKVADQREKIENLEAEVEHRKAMEEKTWSTLERLGGCAANMPRELTAENGAKALLIGEFVQTVSLPLGSSAMEISIPVTWTVIKQIYRKIVDHYESLSDWNEIEGESEIISPKTVEEAATFVRS